MLKKQLSNAKNVLYEEVNNREKILEEIASALVKSQREIISENKKDLKLLDESDPKYDRLKLTADRIENIANEILKVVKLQSPVGQEVYHHQKQNGLDIKKIRVPLGVVGLIYESRPNVTVDAFSLCFKTGNSCVLKGGKEAAHTNRILVKIIKNVLIQNGISEYWITLLEIDRSTMNDLLTANEYIDVLIPRGGKNLINYVRENATLPVIETGAGVVHAYIDESANLDIARDVIFNAKTRRVSVCNALDTILYHKSLSGHLNEFLEVLATQKVKIFADEVTYTELKDYPYLEKARNEHFGTEFLDYKLSIKSVESIEEAVKHINTYGSKHSETIISENEKNIQYFYKMVDASTVYSNASTAFTDGAQFGLGSEIGISTQKLHARGPMALEALTTTKYIVKGYGQVRA